LDLRIFALDNFNCKKKLFYYLQIKIRRVNKVLPPGSANNGLPSASNLSTDPDPVKINKILNGEGTSQSPIDLTSAVPTPKSSEPSPPASASSMPAPVSTPSTTPARTSGPAAPIQLKTVETSPSSMIQVKNKHFIIGS
jgi:hypothetical protein